MSDSVQLHRRQSTRLPRPWDSPGKNTGVGCHFLLQCMKVKSESEVAQSCLTLRDPMDCSPPGSSVLEEYWIGLPLPSPKSFLILSKSKAGPELWCSLFSLGIIMVASVILACFTGSAVSYGHWRATRVKICSPKLT